MQNEKYQQPEIQDRTYQFALDVIHMIDALEMTTSSTQVITKQLLRSATSVGANVAEAQAGSSRKDFTNFLNHSLKSANESKYWLSLLRDSKKLENQTILTLLDEASEISKILGASIRQLKQKNV